jgi:hypothetical protein
MARRGLPVTSISRSIQHSNRQQRTLAALRVFGFPAEQIAAQDVLRQRSILQLGRQPVQIHVMTSISGVNWDSAWDSRQRAAKDLADVEALRPPHNAASNSPSATVPKSRAKRLAIVHR